ncbi:MAG: YybH family protein [Spirosomataceae bacterium]
MRFFLLLFLGLNIQVFAQTPESSIRQAMARQQEAWNRGDIQLFMEDYWKSDSLMFISKNGITRGWQATKNRYLTTYSSRELMGTLTFDLQEIQVVGPKSAWVLGKWSLKRPDVGDIGGYFTLIFKEINGKWVICSDHTS